MPKRKKHEKQPNDAPPENGSEQSAPESEPVCLAFDIETADIRTGRPSEAFGDLPLASIESEDFAAMKLLGMEVQPSEGGTLSEVGADLVAPTLDEDLESHRWIAEVLSEAESLAEKFTDVRPSLSEGSIVASLATDLLPAPEPLLPAPESLLPAPEPLISPSTILPPIEDFEDLSDPELEEEEEEERDISELVSLLFSELKELEPEGSGIHLKLLQSMREAGFSDLAELVGLSLGLTETEKWQDIGDASQSN